jgi:hypothetical protein
MEKCNMVKMLSELLILRIDDENDFGASIEEETIVELRTIDSKSASYPNYILRYYNLRAKLVSKISKYLPCKGLSSHSDKD